MQKFPQKIIVQVRFDEDVARKNPLSVPGFELTTFWLAEYLVVVFYPFSV